MPRFVPPTHHKSRQSRPHFDELRLTRQYPDRASQSPTTRLALRGCERPAAHSPPVCPAKPSSDMLKFMSRSDETNKRLAEIAKRIAKIKAELAAIDEMRPGSLTRQYKDPESHSGAYYQLSYTRDRKSRTEYIAGECLRVARRQIGNYKRFKALSEEWITLSIEQSRLKMKLVRTS